MRSAIYPSPNSPTNSFEEAEEKAAFSASGDCPVVLVPRAAFHFPLGLAAKRRPSASRTPPPVASTGTKVNIHFRVRSPFGALTSTLFQPRCSATGVGSR